MRTLALIFVIVLAITLILAGPLLLLWSLNTLFPVLAIPYAIDTWFATLILSGIFATTVKVNK